LSRPNRWFPLAVAATAGVAAMALYTGAGHLVGSPFPFGELPGVGFAVAVWNAVLILPTRALFRRVARRSEPDRIHLALGR
jgi:Kef-type K+ transport system membrane component KefB